MVLSFSTIVLFNLQILPVSINYLSKTKLTMIQKAVNYIISARSFLLAKQCRQERNTLNRNIGDQKVGVFVPQCNDDGTYKTKQYHGSTGYSWCVDRNTGEEITGTRKGPGRGVVNCDSYEC